MTSVVDRTSIREQVRRILHAQVLSGALVPGQVYSAVALAEELNVSATPVREAMLELANAGFVEVARNRGFRILTISARDLDEIVELRLMLEVPAIKGVIARASNEQLAALGPLADEIVEAARREDIPAYLLSDQTFHRTLLELAGNARLVKLVVDLRDQTRLLGLRGLSASGQLIESAQEHCEIASTIQARNLKQAQALMTRHIQHARGIWAGVAETPQGAGAMYNGTPPSAVSRPGQSPPKGAKS
jgi:DNA-binding GntR family transcriptional regulator